MNALSYGEQFLAPAIARYAALYPHVTVDVDFDDKRVHLIEEGYDVIVRIGALEDSGLLPNEFLISQSYYAQVLILLYPW